MKKTENKKASQIRQIWGLVRKSTFIKLGVSIMILFGIMAVFSPIWININPEIYDPALSDLPGNTPWVLMI
jgi:hypothetical protein